MIIIELMNANTLNQKGEKALERFAARIVDQTPFTLKVEVVFNDGRKAYDTYPVSNVVAVREIPDDVRTS